MQILGPFGMYFDTVVVEVKTFSLLFNLALAILCINVYFLIHFLFLLFWLLGMVREI